MDEPARSVVVVPRPIIRKRTLFNASLAVMGAGVVYLTFFQHGEWAVGYQQNFGLGMALALALGSLVCEYFDSALGMGYGTTLTPLLMILGFEVLDILPCILLSQMVAGIAGGVAHHQMGNVDFRRGGRALPTMLVLAACSIIGTVGAALLAVRLPKPVLNVAIGGLITGVGLFLLIHRHAELRFSWRRITTLGLVAAFNKGLSGGGYGPLVTGGQILAGVSGKNAVGITSLAEGLTCLVGLIAYGLTMGLPDWRLALPLTAGALVSIPAATYTVRLMPPQLLKGTIGWVTVFLGSMALLKVIMG
jgi:hypothetical protein